MNKQNCIYIPTYNPKYVEILRIQPQCKCMQDLEINQIHMKKDANARIPRKYCHKYNNNYSGIPSRLDLTSPK